MCSYKLVKVEFKYWGIQRKMENWILDLALRKTILKVIHLSCEYYNFSGPSTSLDLARRMVQPDNGGHSTSREGNPAKARTKVHEYFARRCLCLVRFAGKEL